MTTEEIKLHICETCHCLKGCGYIQRDKVDSCDRIDIANYVMEKKDQIVEKYLTIDLTPEDIRRILDISDDLLLTPKDRAQWEDKEPEEYYSEVLRRFKEVRSDGIPNT